MSIRIATFRHVKSRIAFNLVPGGTYQKGSPFTEAGRAPDEGPVQTIRVPPLLVGVTEVSQEQWDRVGGSDNRARRGAKLPIEGVSWSDCRTWLAKASDGLRLLSESEWEYVCRAETSTPFFFGNTISSSQVNFDSNRPYGAGKKKQSREKTISVDSLSANAFGLYHVHGNVYEWCEDNYSDKYSGTNQNHIAVHLGDSTKRVIRGGSWNFAAKFCRSADRLGIDSTVRKNYIGFRVAKSVD